MAAFVSEPAPEFKADAYVNGEFKQISLSQFKGKKVVLFFYPLDFTFVCPTEILAFVDSIDEFKKRNTEVIGVSVDSKFTHMAWANTAREDGGIKGVNYPLVSDLNKQIARDYGVLIEDRGIALRGLFVIDPEGILRYKVVHDLNVGRSAEETLRVIQALQTGGLCQAEWKPGQKTLN